VTTAERTVQRDRALERAQAARTAAMQIRVEVAAGLLTVPAALKDPRAQPMPIGRLLLAQRGWGQSKVNRLCRRLELWPARRVRDLTQRQRALIATATTKETTR
jgi:hypothetical protein